MPYPRHLLKWQDYEPDKNKLFYKRIWPLVCTLLLKVTVVVFFQLSFLLLFWTECDTETKRVQDVLSGMEKPQVRDA